VRLLPFSAGPTGAAHAVSCEWNGGGGGGFCGWLRLRAIETNVTPKIQAPQLPRGVGTPRDIVAGAFAVHDDEQEARRLQQRFAV